MKKFLTFCTIFLSLFFITFLANAAFSSREQHACGHVTQQSPIKFWNKYHFCERNNVLAQLQSIQAACRFYFMENQHAPTDLKTLVDQQYLAVSLFENNPIQFNLARDKTGLLIIGRVAKNNMLVELRMNGKYRISEETIEVSAGRMKQ